MVKKILNYTIIFISLFIFLTIDVKALTLDTQDITWYYRNTSDENTLLNTIKNIDTPLHIVNGEYMNGFTTRQDYTFNKDIQYMINYKLIYRYYEGLDGSFRTDTIDRLISYSWVDSDFKLLNSNVNQTKYLCETDICTREFTISQQVLTLNNTSGIRFGVYTTEAKSLGFYNPSSGSDGVYITLSNYISIEDNSSSTIINQNNQIINGQNSLQNSITNTEDNINQNIDDMESAIVDSNKETQDVIKDQFNSCRDSYNLINYKNFTNINPNTTINIIKDGLIVIKSTNSSGYGVASETLSLKANTTYTISTDSLWDISKPSSWGWRLYNVNDESLTNFSRSDKFTFTTNNNTQYILYYYIGSPNTDIGQVTLSNIMLNEGSTAKPYDPYGEEICTNKLDEQNETQKGIWDTIKNLPNAFMDMLKGLFIPEDGYFELWFNDLKMFFEDKLGFLATPFTIIIDFVNRYLDLNPSEDIIINIPDITVPNFEDHIIVKATTFNWSQLLKSKDSLNTLWQLYLSFVDVFLILNFINLCENKYNRIFGGDTTQYEYYTVEDSYNVDVNTGEIKSQRRNERTTTRKKVN